jgi:hypothetical protein
MRKSVGTLVEMRLGVKRYLLAILATEGHTIQGITKTYVCESIPTLLQAARALDERGGGHYIRKEKFTRVSFIRVLFSANGF